MARPGLEVADGEFALSELGVRLLAKRPKSDVTSGFFKNFTPLTHIARINKGRNSF